MTQPLTLRCPGIVDYQSCWQDMKDFVANRQADTCDEIWLLQHPPVFTQGMAGNPEHILNPGDIPVIQTDRGGQVTYHGPGQIVAYHLLDIRRRKLGVRKLVTLLEASVITLLREYGIEAHGNRSAPGVYVEDTKLAALGLRVQKKSTYHGLSLNVDPDLEPFSRINPCGYQGLKVTSLKKLGIEKSLETIQQRLHYHLCTTLDYTYVT